MHELIQELSTMITVILMMMSIVSMLMCIESTQWSWFNLDSLELMYGAAAFAATGILCMALSIAGGMI